MSVTFMPFETMKSFNCSGVASFETPEAMLEDIGKPVRTMPQIKIDGELVGGYNQLIEYYADKGKVNFKGEVISE